jgi:hypothetical protein
MPGSILFLAGFQTIVKSKYLIIALTASRKKSRRTAEESRTM